MQRKQREAEAVVLTQFFLRYPTEVLCSLVARYKPDLIHMGKIFQGDFYRPNIPLEDYAAVSISSLAGAAKNFDPTQGTSFFTYLFAYAKKECKKFAFDNGTFLRVFRSRSPKNANKGDKEQDKIPAVYATPLEDLSDNELIYTADANENPQREREKEEAQKTVQALRQFLNELLKGYELQENQNRLSVPQKRAALVLEYIDFFLKHADDPGMGRTMKTAFLASKKKKCRETLDKAIDYVIKQFSLYSKTQSTNKLANLQQTKE